MTFDLPFPPTVNTYWRHDPKTRRTLLSRKGRAFKQEAVLAVRSQMLGLFPLDDPADVTITLHPPDKRKRDADNYGKAVMDALVDAGVLEDDNSEYVRSITVRWDEQRKGGECSVAVEPIEC